MARRDALQARVQAQPLATAAAFLAFHMAAAALSIPGAVILTLAEASKYVAGEWKRAHAPQRMLRWVEKCHAWQLA